MLTLAFDSCMNKIYAVLVKDEKVLSSVTEEFNANGGRSSDIIRIMKKILLDNNMNFDDVDLVATNIGPGSFTAIRTSLTVARVIGQELGKKVIGVSTFEILENLPFTSGSKKKITVLDARRESAYVKTEDGEPYIVPLSELKETLKKEDYFIITDNRLQEITNGISYETSDINLAEIIARLAVKKSQTETGEWGKLQPLYMNSPAKV
ncbi:tRNA (adenosine(37)-N6)-threonylcarbamoyltransferase complex dimerization subunit type 1 TsaB [bacterium]|nr:tRNA (adenosine(37)-N6)-threonylcarbamoyltransferase complex dimerization subunit type 1 TsaB [bacterium]